jgi:hypothetical protein
MDITSDMLDFMGLEHQDKTKGSLEFEVNNLERPHLPLWEMQPVLKKSQPQPIIRKNLNRTKNLF